MKDKYYTPELEEFHIGFEYEFKPRERNGIISYINNNHTYLPKWKKESFGREKTLMERIGAFYDYDEPEYLSDIESYITDKTIRVKYLDREDIESLGWKVSELHNVEYSRENFTTYENDTHYMVVYNQGGKRAWFCVYRKEVDGDGGELIAEFRVTIKNKSELKRILKQIGVRVK